MKNKEYLQVTGKRTGRTNPLKLSEVHLVSKLAKEWGEDLIVSRVSTTKEAYKCVFG